MRYLLLASLIFMSGCGTIRKNVTGCNPVIKEETLDIVKLIADPESEWVCSQSIWQR